MTSKIMELLKRVVPERHEPWRVVNPFDPGPMAYTITSSFVWEPEP